MKDDDFEQLTRETLRAARVTKFDDGFANRAWERYGSSDDANVVSLVQYSAKRLVPFAIAASLLLALYSAIATSPLDASLQHRTVVERMLGWNEPVRVTQVSSVYDVYGLSSLMEDR